ncbi:MAG TPA: hypothetical protein VFV08_09865, partial [Puia sp.]|nr:hypothetical protein [Puia sp.]
MKKLLFLFCCFVGQNFAHAQKCLNIHLGNLLSNLPASANGSQSLNKCITNKNNQSGQTDITSFGSDLDQYDTMISKTTAEFNNTAAAAMTNHAPTYSQDDAAAAKDLAETLKSMTPEQQKEWAMQMAQARQKNPGMGSQQEDASSMRLVIETQDIAGRQLKEVNDEFLAKLQALDAAEDEKIKAIAKGDKSKCPSDITGLPSCSCT